MPRCKKNGGPHKGLLDTKHFKCLKIDKGSAKTAVHMGVYIGQKVLLDKGGGTKFANDKKTKRHFLHADKNFMQLTQSPKI
jgi:hypothetical protein